MKIEDIERIHLKFIEFQTVDGTTTKYSEYAFAIGDLIEIAKLAKIHADGFIVPNPLTDALEKIWRKNEDWED